VDLHLIPSAAPTDEERGAVDSVLGEAETGWGGGERRALDGHIARGGHEQRARRHQLLPALHALTDRVGWISEGGLNYVSQRLDVAPAEVYGVASFYALFSTEPRPSTVLHLCDDIACKTAGADALIEEVLADVGPERAEQIVRSPCLGLCERAPAAFLQTSGEGTSNVSFGPVATSSLEPFLHGGAWTMMSGRDPYEKVPQTRSAESRASLRLLRRVGLVDPTSLEDHRAHGGYEALRRATELGPGGVIQELKDSNLLGRGGAAFPAGVKWEAVAKQPVRPHYFICNADESEPGTFKDRVLMENDPFAVLEALTIAGYATGSERAFLYIRGEYPLATQRLERAITEARHRGFLGDDVMGEGFAFDLELRRGAGAYICGEETALFNSIEGKRGEPRNKPPFPVAVGLFGRPTLVHNVETLANVLRILDPDGPGVETKLFSVAGHVGRPGVYEVPMGTTLRELLDLAGGVAGTGRVRAVLLGGAAGTFVAPEHLDVVLTAEATRAIGATLGSGAVIVLDDGTDLEAVVLRIAAFFRDESCGQCVPCRVGTVRQEEALHRLARGTPLGTPDDELARLHDVGNAMRDASICGLGQTAWNAVESALATFGAFRANGSESS